MRRWINQRMMMKTLFVVGLGLAACSFPLSAQPKPLAAQRNSDAIQDNRVIPVHAKICNGNIVNKTKLFFQLLANASPPMSDKLKFSIGDWHKLVTDKNICPQFSGCGPKDAES